MSGLREMFAQQRVRRDNQVLRDRLIKEGKINDEARKPTPKRDARLDRALRKTTRGILTARP